MEIPGMEILYEDNHLIAVNKSSSELVQGDETGDISLDVSLKQYLKKKYNKPGNVFLGVVHRLDRPVSGLVIFARTSKALERLNRQVAGKEIRKTYWAVVRNRPPAVAGQLVHYLAKDEKKNKSFAVSEGRKDGKQAVLDYRMLGAGDQYYLLEIGLHTGRHHQIRVQLSKIGCPIKGDTKYGFPRPNASPFIHLHARKLDFVHPVSQEDMHFTAPPPDDPLWNYFISLNL